MSWNRYASMNDWQVLKDRFWNKLKPQIENNMCDGSVIRNKDQENTIKETNISEWKKNTQSQGEGQKKEILVVRRGMNIMIPNKKQKSKAPDWTKWWKWALVAHLKQFGEFLLT